MQMAGGAQNRQRGNMQWGTSAPTNIESTPFHHSLRGFAHDINTTTPLQLQMFFAQMRNPGNFVQNNLKSETSNKPKGKQQLLPFRAMQTTMKRLATPVWSSAVPWLSSTATATYTTALTTPPPPAPALRSVALPTTAASFGHFTTATNQVGLPGGFSVMNPNLKDLEGDDYLYHLGLNPAE